MMRFGSRLRLKATAGGGQSENFPARTRSSASSPENFRREPARARHRPKISGASPLERVIARKIPARTRSSASSPENFRRAATRAVVARTCDRDLARRICARSRAPSPRLPLSLSPSFSEAAPTRAGGVDRMKPGRRSTRTRRSREAGSGCARGPRVQRSRGGCAPPWRTLRRTRDRRGRPPAPACCGRGAAAPDTFRSHARPAPPRSGRAPPARPRRTRRRCRPPRLRPSRRPPREERARPRKRRGSGTPRRARDARRRA